MGSFSVAFKSAPEAGRFNEAFYRFLELRSEAPQELEDCNCMIRRFLWAAASVRSSPSGAMRPWGSSSCYGLDLYGLGFSGVAPQAYGWRKRASSARFTTIQRFPSCLLFI